MLDADETNDLLQVSADKVYRARQWHTTRRNDDICTLAFEQPFRSIGTVTKGDAGASNQVDPGFQ